MYVHCMYGLGSHPVPKRNIRITYGLGSDRFSPNAAGTDQGIPTYLYLLQMMIGKS